MDIKQLNEEYASLHTEANKLIGTIAVEKRDFSAEEKELNAKRFTRMDQIKSVIDQRKKLAEYAFSEYKPEEPKGKAAFDQHQNKATFSENQKRDIFNQFLRSGVRSEDLFTITTSTESSTYLPKGVLAPVEIRRLPNSFRKAVVSVLGESAILKTSTTEAFDLPIENDASVVGESISESVTSGNAADPSTSDSTDMNVTLWSSKQRWFSNTMILANNFDVAGYVLPLLAKRLEKARETAATTVLQTLTTSMVTSTHYASMIFTDLISWEHALPAAYREDAVFLLADSLYQLLRSMIDTANRPILDVDPTGTFVGTIHGKPVIVNDYLTATAASAKSGAFVSASAIKIRDVVPQRIKVYVNDKEYVDQTGYEIIENGCISFVPQGVRLLRMNPSTV